MHSYQTANNSDKMMEMGRKVLKIDADDPEALVGVAEVLAERTRDTDLDKDQRLDEGTKLAHTRMETVDTDITVPAGYSQEKIDAYKGFLRSNAYYVLGTIQYTREKYADAEGYFRKSIDAFPSQPDPLAVLRLALSLDKQEKYPEALKYANQAVQMTEANQGSTLATLSRNERDRLVQLTGGTPAAKPPASAAEPGAQELVGPDLGRQTSDSSPERIVRGRNVRRSESPSVRFLAANMKPRDIALLQAALGYRFQRAELLEQALTHSSQARELEALQAAGGPRVGDNEQLEFLGDAVLGLVTTEELFHRFPAFGKENSPSSGPTWSAKNI